MVYLDASVVLAELLSEDRHPPPTLWENETLVSSRLLEFEVWNRINAHGLHQSHGEDVRTLLAGVSFVEIGPETSARATQPFPVRVRTLNALHLAAMDFLRAHGQDVRLASYDDRLVTAAKRLGFKTVVDV